MEGKGSQEHRTFKASDWRNISKYLSGLNSTIGFRAIKRRCQIIRQSSAIKLWNQTGYLRLVRMKVSIQKVKHYTREKARVSARKLPIELTITCTSV